MLCAAFGKGYSAAAPTESQTGITSRVYRANGSARPVLWLHSAGAGAVGAASQEPWTATNMPPLLRAITGRGVPLLSADCSGSGHWGNDTAQARVTDMLAFIRSDAQLKASAALAPIVCGVSMGGMLALNWARANPALVRALCLFYPAVNLQAQHDGTGGAAAGGAAGTEAAYGGSLASFNAAVAAHDPAQHAVDYQQFPIQMHYSDVDAVVGGANEAAFAAAVGGGNLETHVLAGAAHADMTKIDVAAFTAFLSAHL